MKGDVVEIQPFGDLPRRTLLLQAMPIRLEDGELAGAVVAQTDISDRVRAEAELRASEARFRTIADAMPQMVWSALPDGYHDYFNRQWYDFTGCPKGRRTASDGPTFFIREDQPEAWARWRHSLATGEDYEIQYRLRHHSGEYRWVLGRAVPVRDERGAHHPLDGHLHRHPRATHGAGRPGAQRARAARGRPPQGRVPRDARA